MREIERPAGVGNRQPEWGSDVAAELLRRLDVEFIALNPGASYRGLHDSLVNYLGNETPRMLLCLHEDTAVAVAHGYAKVAERPMACALHSNVGLMHGLMAIFNAWCDRVPMLVLGATGPVDAAARRPWIDWIHTAKDQGAWLRAYTKWDDEPRSPTALVESLLRAWQLTETAPPGPVYVCLDAGLQESRLAEAPAIPDLARFRAAPGPGIPAPTLERAAALLLEARRPLLMIGRVSRSLAGWDERVRLAEALGAGVVTDLKTGAAFPTEHPLHLAPPRYNLADAGRDALRAADAVLALDWIDLASEVRLAGGSDAVRGPVIACSLDEQRATGFGMEHFGLPPRDLPIAAEPDALVSALLPLVEARLAERPRSSAATPGERAKPTAYRPGPPDGSIAPAEVAHALDRLRRRPAYRERRITLARVTIGWDASAYSFDTPLDYLGTDGGAGLGTTPGLTIGAALAMRRVAPERLVVAVIGDGDFLQASSALWTAARYGVPALFVISNNRSNFNDEIHQETMARQRGRAVENRWIGQRIDDPPVDLAGLARAQGVEACGPIERLADLDGALDTGLAAVAAGRPYLVDVRVEPGYTTAMMTRASGTTASGRSAVGRSG